MFRTLVRKCSRGWIRRCAKVPELPLLRFVKLWPRHSDAGTVSRFPIILAVIALTIPTAANETPHQRKNIVYAEAHGVGLIMDIFTPAGGKMAWPS